jgi:hypothetical protein
MIGTFRRLAGDRRGAAALLFAIMVPVMMGFAGLGIEVGFWLMEARAMQGAADAAAASAATALALQPGCVVGGSNICITEARSVAALNGWTNGVNNVQVIVNSPPASGNFTTNNAAVEVIIKQTGTNWFSGFLPAGYAAPTVGARSVALANPSLDCLLSLNNTSTPGINFALLLGSVNMSKCSIGVNSKGSNALEITGILTSVTAYTATVYGGINSGFLNAFNWTKTPRQNQNTITPDPYGCPGTQCRTMPTPTIPTAITPLGTTALPGTCTGNSGNTISVAHNPGTLIAGTCYPGISVSAGQTLTLTTSAGAAYTIKSPTGQPAISVTGGTLNITIGGNFKILGNSQPAISVTGGAANFGPGTNIIQGGTGQPGITVSGGTVNFGAGTNSILGGSSAPGITMTGGTVTFAGGTGSSTFFQGGSSNPAIQLNGSTPSLTIDALTNSVLAGSSSSAITVNGTSNTSPYAQLTFGNSNNSIQTAAADNGAHSALTITGYGHVVFGNGTSVFGGPTVTANVPAVNDDAGFLAGLGRGLVLGSGTFQFMEGISVTGGDLTLNPPATSGGIGYYIMDGGSNGGFNMTFGDLIGTNVTLVLTGGTAGGVGAADYANMNFNGADGMTLTAPTAAGTWNTAGIAIFQDRTAPAGNTNTIYGINFDNITGAIYTPSQALNFEGLSIMNSQCMQLIANTIKILGLAFINDQCQGTGTAPIGGNGSIILAE